MAKIFFKREEQHNLEIAYNNKAAFYCQYSETEKSQRRNLLLKILNTRENEELYRAVIGILDEQIAKAGKAYVDILEDGISARTGGLNGDIYLDKKAYEIDE